MMTLLELLAWLVGIAYALAVFHSLLMGDGYD
jgi:hypothetical protein